MKFLLYTDKFSRFSFDNLCVDVHTIYFLWRGVRKLFTTLRPSIVGRDEGKIYIDPPDGIAAARFLCCPIYFLDHVYKREKCSSLKVNAGWIKFSCLCAFIVICRPTHTHAVSGRLLEMCDSVAVPAPPASYGRLCI